MLTPKQKLDAGKGLDSLMVQFNGSAAQLARAIRVEPATVRQWRARGWVSRAGYRAIWQYLGRALADAVRPDMAFKPSHQE